MSKKKSARQSAPAGYSPVPEEDGDCVTQEQSDQTQQIIQTGTVTPTKGKHVIHCLTIVGLIVVIDNKGGSA